MKRAIITIVIIFLTAAMTYAYGALDHFAVSGLSGTLTAGNPISILIQAEDSGNNIVASYAGSVSFSASVGYVTLQSTGTNITPDFSTGILNGTIVFSGAGNPVTLTAEDLSGMTVTSNVYNLDIAPNSYSKLLILAPGMTYAPGTSSGYTGFPVTQTTTIPFNVTVYATDSNYNMVTSSSSAILTAGCTTGCSNSVTPSSFSLSSGIGYFSVTLTPSPDSASYYVLNCNDTHNPLINDSLSVYFNTLTQFYIWAQTPSSVIAGVPFSVTVTMSHSPYGNSINAFTGQATISLQTLNPAAVIPINGNISITNGIGVTMVSYNKRDTNNLQANLEVVPYYSCCDTSISPTVEASSLIDVYSNSPVICSFTADNYTLGNGNTANLAAFIEDTYGNPVSNTAVGFSIISGTGSISTGTAKTDYSGNADIVFTAPDANTRTVIAAYPHGLTIVPTVELICSISAPDSHKIINQPNPFAAGRETTAINYYLDYDSDVKIWVYNVYGGILWKKEISKGSDGGMQGGDTVIWDGKTNNGYMAGVGLYILRLTVKNSQENYTLERRIAIKK